MRRLLILVPLLLILVVGISTPTTTSGLNELKLQQRFVDSVDGAEWGNITFAETLDGLGDDVLFYPDTFDNGTTLASSRLLGANTGETNTYTSTHDKDSTSWTVYADGGEIFDAELWFSFDSSRDAIEAFDYAIYANDDDATATFSVYNSTGDSWTTGSTSLTASPAWYNSTISDSNMWNSTSIGFRFTDTDADGSIDIDYAEINLYVMLYGNGNNRYSTGFFNITDWGEFTGNEGDDTIATDGDVVTLTFDNDGASDIDGLNNSLGGAYSTDLNYEVRIRCSNVSITKIQVQFRTDTTNEWYVDLKNSMTNDEWYTSAGKISTLSSVGGGSTFDNVLIRVWTDDSNVDQTLDVDYLRIAPADEFGWEHDGSTTTGIQAVSGGSVSSDGDYISMIADASSGTNFWIDYETTTQANLNLDYYQSLEILFSADSIGNQIRIQAVNESAGWYTILAKTTITSTLVRYNIRAAVDGDLQKIYIYGYDSEVTKIDYIKIDSIANFTVSSVSNENVNDYLYAENGILYCNGVSTDHFQLAYDTNPNIDTLTYNEAVLTTDSSDIRMNPYISGAFQGYSDQYDTRFALDSGNLTSLNLRIYEAGYISAITFIEDGTAPDADIAVTPTDPYFDEDVTLSSIVFDDVEVYEVSYNAISSPATFSDIDYSATEGQENYWSYTFSAGDLPIGDYCFKVIAGDGANNSTITASNRDYATVRFTVREAAIIINPITFSGAGTDFSTITLSFDCNRDGTYAIDEWTETDGSDVSTTHSGSVIDGWNNIAWDKLTTTSSTVYFNFTITSSTLTFTFNNQYQVAQTALAINSYDWGWTEAQVFVNYDMNKGGTYTAYIDGSQDSTSSFSSGSNFLNWSRGSSTDPSEVDYAVKLTDGTTTLWLNNSVDEYSLTTFSIRTLQLSTIGDNVVAIATTSLENGTLYLYENDVLKDSGVEGSTLSYAKSTVAGTYIVDLKIDCGDSESWFNDTSYTVAETSFTLDLWQVNILEYNINIDWQTSFGNSTLKAYDNNSLTATGTNENFTLQFAKSSVVGLHDLDFLIDSGSSTIWKNNTNYEVAQDQIVLSNPFYGELTNSWIFSATVNQAVNYYVYDNDSLQTTGSKATGFFAISRDFVNSIGKHIVSIKFNTSDDSEWAGGSYDVSSTLSIDSIDTDQDNDTVTVGFRVVRTASSSLSWSAYESGLRATGTETVTVGDFISIAFDKSYVNIEGTAVVVLSDGTSTRNITVIYKTVDQADYLTVNGGSTINNDYVRPLEVENFQVIIKETQIIVTAYVTQPCSIMLYHNGQLVDSGDLSEGTFKITLDKIDLPNVNVTAKFSYLDQTPITIYREYGYDETTVYVTNAVMVIAIFASIAALLAFLAMDRRFLSELKKTERYIK